MAYRITVDAGHGGFDTGASYYGRNEKDDNLRLALAVGQILADSGIDVNYTRTVDIYQSPLRKAQIANERGSDFFLSLHRNSSEIPNQYNGVQSLIYNTGDIKEVFAQNINTELEMVGFQNLGVVARPNLIVLNQTQMPAVLVEVGFINSDVDNALFDERFPETANAIARGVIQTIIEE